MGFFFKDWEDKEKEELKLDEGLRLKKYLDTAVPPVETIGYGHTDKNLPESCTLEQAEEWLDDDVQEAHDLARKIVASFDALDGARKGVILNMTFNLGNRLSEFHNTIKYINIGDYRAAAENMLKSKWAKQVGNRAKRLAYRMATGNYALRT